MGVQDNYWTYGEEAVAYGTAAATLTRGIEVQEDDHKAVVEPLISRGMRAGTVSTPTTSYAAHLRGATGTLTLDLLNKAHGLLYKAGSASVATTTPVGGTLTRLHTFTPTVAGPTTSLSVHLVRNPLVDAGEPFTHVGGMVTELKFSQDPKAYGKLAASMDYTSVLDSTDGETARTPAYPTTPFTYSDADCLITLDATTECQKKFEVTLPTGVDTDMWRICRTTGKEKPVVKARTQPTGMLSVDYVDNTFYRKFIDHDPMALVVEWIGPVIEGALTYFLRLTCANICFTGDTPKVSLDDLPNQDLPFEMLDEPGVAPPWKIEYQTTDVLP